MAIATQGSGFLTLLRKRHFLSLWLAQLISMTILQASNYALLILIQKTTRSTTLIGLAIISFSIPAILFGAPAGVFVDRLDKRRVLWACNCLRALATFIFVLALLTKQGGLLPLYLLTFLVSAISQFFAPAEGAAIPMLVADEELMPALSLFNITFMLSQALGFVLLGPLALSFLPTFTISSISIDAIVQLYAAIGLLYLVCAFLVTLIPKKSFKQSSNASTPPVAAQTLGALGHVWTEMRQGWTFVRRNKPLFLAVIQLSFAGILILVIGELATPIVTQMLLLSPNTMAFIFAPAGIGLVAGSVAMPRITQRLGKARTILLGTITLSISTLLLPLSTLLAQSLQPNSWNSNPLLLIVIAFFMFVAGIGLNAVNIPAQTAMQELSPDWIKGRVLALQLVLYNACSIPVILLIGALSDLATRSSIFSIDHVLYILATGEMAFGLWGVFYARKVAHLPEKESIQQEPELETIMPATSKLVD